jgi:hypothetical protein
MAAIRFSGAFGTSNASEAAATVPPVIESDAVACPKVAPRPSLG